MKPAMIYGMVAVVAIILVILAARYYKNEAFTPVSTNYSNDSNDSNDYTTEIRENYPTAPQNVLVSDANGNLTVTNDLGMQHLTVAGNAQIGNLNVKDRNILADLDTLAAKIVAVNARVDAVNARVDAANTRIEAVNTATNARIDTVNNTAVFYDTAVKTLADNGIMNGGAYGAAGNFMSFGNCDQCAGGSDKFKLWPNAGATTSFKFVKKYPL